MSAMFFSLRRPLVMFLISLGFAGCAQDPSDVNGLAAPIAVAPTTTASPEIELTGVVVDIRAIDNNFRPRKIDVKVGDTLRFTNGGRNEHDITPLAGTQWGVLKAAEFPPGAVYDHVFAEPGEYAYFCSVHGTNKVGMVGLVRVTA